MQGGKVRRSQGNQGENRRREEEKMKETGKRRAEE